MNDDRTRLESETDEPSFNALNDDVSSPGDAMPGADPLGVEISGEDVVLPATADDLVVEPAAIQPEPPRESDAGPGSLADLIAAVGDLAGRMERQLEGLQTRFDREIRAEATREKVVDRLHAELQEYKQDLLLNTLRPVFIDLIQLHDDIGKVAVAGPEASPAEARLIDLMRGFQQGIEDILYRQGVEPFENEGSTFDPRRQRAVSTAACGDSALNKTIAARIRKGFRAGDRVIRPEIVSVYAFKA
ncbi:MAG: nucleotide exchange factor GrpE [Isosphaeraceae bacterium]